MLVLQMLAVVCVPRCVPPVIGVLDIPASEDTFIDWGIRICKVQAVA